MPDVSWACLENEAATWLAATFAGDFVKEAAVLLGHYLG